MRVFLWLIFIGKFIHKQYRYEDSYSLMNPSNFIKKPSPMTIWKFFLSITLLVSINSNYISAEAVQQANHIKHFWRPFWFTNVSNNQKKLLILWEPHPLKKNKKKHPAQFIKTSPWNTLRRFLTESEHCVKEINWAVKHFQQTKSVKEILTELSC